ncbi:C45 family autoproteolytic acyltransferase/hydrolase [Brevibacillus laterosporus]|uniref:C45 family autoproteolytic acyltransferase/hydolase n=1 Tax=Brevibacillus laterosporus TaxID=1465 RepID=UPI0018CD9603|nr:C45 family peptidase [Brevibacillus laterosporus]MBG9798481.1 choloylglycine hydrolase [Brevibacillus laterosporus]MCR8936756.1 C45 family peptidase [Brevibacillus laterosporus]MCZ0839395.1 C45 family autoproteolytic acyltransferase/hydrolase [Brevibacillus laterosporus]MCZ0846832.1 C45 family autoproteolytic acyltransferase/hydrolase [Brevibacillus laterosporus]MED1912065.1 C45 family autoproteolytic acyltransferase/hydrolase [Brevibacillus laterosporus]
MQTRQGYFTYLEGTNKEVGEQQAEILRHIPYLYQVYFLEEEEAISDQRLWTQQQMLQQYSPGIWEELEAFCSQAKMPMNRLRYLHESCIVSGCTHSVVLPAKMRDGHLYVLRNYEFTPDLDDMRLCSTNIGGTYVHTGFSGLSFGRMEGMNDQGLCITMSSCGQPVGIHPSLRSPKGEGLQFWTAIRTVLEQCRNVDEALQRLREMPIVSNVNLLVADPNENAALVEIMDGDIAIRKIGKERDTPYLVATNHVLFSELEHTSTHSMHNSLIRQQLLESVLQEEALVEKADLLALMNSEYPKGLSTHYYQEYFGTLRSMLFDVTAKTIEVCYGSPLHNNWHTLSVGGKLAFPTLEVALPQGVVPAHFW